MNNYRYFLIKETARDFLKKRRKIGAKNAQFVCISRNWRISAKIRQVPPHCNQVGFGGTITGNVHVKKKAYLSSKWRSIYLENFFA